MNRLCLPALALLAGFAKPAPGQTGDEGLVKAGALDFAKDPLAKATDTATCIGTSRCGDPPTPTSLAMFTSDEPGQSRTLLGTIIKETLWSIESPRTAAAAHREGSDGEPGFFDDGGGVLLPAPGVIGLLGLGSIYAMRRSRPRYPGGGKDE